MSNLVIKLTGAIQNSNFDEWKDELIQQIRAVNSELQTDSEFALATKSVKQFKAAEKALKEAKQSALEQAADINQLFDAIDAVAEETRQVRLSLERQIKSRKQEIKEETVAAGVDVVKQFISQQPAEFQLISHETWLDEDHFAEAVKGKASTKGMQTAINTLCNQIKKSIETKVAEVKSNTAVLDSLQADHKLLFQDRAALLVMPANELNTTIDKRIDAWRAQQASSTAPTPDTPDPSVSPEPVKMDSSAPNTLADTQWQIVVDVQASQADAELMLDDLKAWWKDQPAIKSISLEHN